MIKKLIKIIEPEGNFSDDLAQPPYFIDRETGTEVWSPEATRLVRRQGCDSDPHQVQ